MTRLRVPSPVGDWVIEGSDDGLHRVYLPHESEAVAPSTEEVNPLVTGAARELGEYFTGERRSWDTPLMPLGGTEFQNRVWEVLRGIPYGDTRTYGDVALELDLPGGARAVGGANGSNPLPIFIPCHRVVGANSMGGYAGGLEVKLFLLHLEGSRT
jgi:methylated-DNA-[protein]-cysteine S-methyltransferase